MWLKLLLVATLSITRSLTEAPFNNQAPYAPAGFRPSIPFDLPGEYYPPFEVESEQSLPNQGISFEVSRQRVDFAGQEIQRVPVSEPQNQYLPPEQIVFVNNRVGNNNRGTRVFRHRHSHRRPNDNGAGDGRTAQSSPSPNRPPQFQPNLPPTNILRPNFNTDERFESQQFFPKEQQKPALEYGVPNYNIDPRNSGSKLQQPSPQYAAPFNNANSNVGHTSAPSLEYGAPNNNNNYEQQHQKPALEYGTPAISESQREEELEKQFALDALKAAVRNYNRLQENLNDKIAEGQYFIVNPDHSIQKVKFTTKQSEDETKQNDFTALLKYTKVGEINDPLYKYTADGQLVRIVKK